MILTLCFFMSKVVSAKEELCRLEDEHRQLEEREREEAGRVAQLTARVEELEADCDGYRDQLKNLEVRKRGGNVLMAWVRQMVERQV